MYADCHRHLSECGIGTRGRPPCGSPARPRLGDLDRRREPGGSHAAVHRLRHCSRSNHSSRQRKRPDDRFRVDTNGERSDEPAAQSFERVIDGHGPCILKKYRRLAAGSGTLPDDVAPRERCRDLNGILCEPAERVERHGRIADPFVESIHQFRLLRDRKVRELDRSRIASCQETPITRAMLRGVSKECLQPVRATLRQSLFGRICIRSVICPREFNRA